jgi:hypothetical protein
MVEKGMILVVLLLAAIFFERSASIKCYKQKECDGPITDINSSYLCCLYHGGSYKKRNIDGTDWCLNCLKPRRKPRYITEGILG